MKYQTLFFYMRIRRREVLHSNDLLTIETMPSWSDISLALYKEFSEQYLIPTIFRYYLENGEIIDVRFEELFYIKDKQLKDSSVKADYIKYTLIDNKGANVGIRYFENQYIAYTMLIDRSINPTATVEGLIPIRIEKLEIIRDGEIVETIVHK